MTVPCGVVSSVPPKTFGRLVVRVPSLAVVSVPPKMLGRDVVRSRPSSLVQS